MYKVGEVYFRMTYPDVRMLYPVIETFVYLGMNFSDSDIEDTWYFQPASDFGRHGSALEGIERPVVCVGQNELSDMIDITDLKKVLEQAAARRAAERETQP